MIRNILALLGLLSVALVTAVTVSAHDWDWNEDRPPSLRVNFSDLNLSTAQGQTTLDRRIARAVDRICGRVSFSSIAQRMEIERCRRNALRSTETQVARAVNRARDRGIALAATSIAPPAGDGRR